jgi:hypothetical protein
MYNLSSSIYGCMSSVGLQWTIDENITYVIFCCPLRVVNHHPPPPPNYSITLLPPKETFFREAYYLHPTSIQTLTFFAFIFANIAISYLWPSSFPSIFCPSFFFLLPFIFSHKCYRLICISSLSYSFILKFSLTALCNNDFSVVSY